MYVFNRPVARPNLRGAICQVSRPSDVASRAARIRLNVLSIVAVMLIGLVIVTTASAAGTDDHAAPGGDFPAFYAAGSIVLDGQGSASLYDVEVQQSYEAPLIGSASRFLPYSYPANFAVFYAPFAMLPYRYAAGLNSLLLFMALIAAVLLVRPMVPLVNEWIGVVSMVALVFTPLTASLVMGQNVALTLVLFAWIWRSLYDDNEFAAGTAVALMMFRPQYGLPVLGLLLVGRHYRAVLAAGVGMAVTWIVTSAVVGSSWVADWLAFAHQFVSSDGGDRAVFLVSPLGFLRSALGEESSVAVVLGMAASLAAAVGMVWLWNKRSVPLDMLMSTTALGIVLTSPHSGGFAPSVILVWVAVTVSRERSRWWVAPLVLLIGFFEMKNLGTLAGGALGAFLVTTGFVISFSQAAAASIVGCDNASGDESAIEAAADSALVGTL